MFLDGKRCTLWSSVLHKSGWIDKCQHFEGIHGFNVQGIRHIYHHNLNHRYEQVPYCTVPVDA